MPHAQIINHEQFHGSARAEVLASKESAHGFIADLIMNAGLSAEAALKVAQTAFNATKLDVAQSAEAAPQTVADARGPQTTSRTV